MSMDFWFATSILSALSIGWLVGRYSFSRYKKLPQTDPNDCSESYIKGLNYLLANNSDKAIELFIDLIKVDKETMETHLALGNLFRSKGEVDRAIKIHQNLIARPNLDQNQRIMAITELAEDYLKAGLLDRAENLFKELVQINPKNLYALRKLLELYSMEKSWSEAKDTALILCELNEKDAHMIVTHCYCEIAENFIGKGNLREARENLHKAININDLCTRALLLLIRVHLKTDDLPEAERLLKKLIKNSPEFIALYMEPVREIYLTRGSTRQFQSFLLNQYDNSSSSAVALELLESYQSSNQHQVLAQFLHRVLQTSGSLELFDFAFGYLKSRPQQLEQVWTDLTSHIKEIRKKRASYICSACGFRGREMQWNCPSCKSWSTIKPV